MNAQRNDVFLSNFGIVVTVATRYWRRMPLHIKLQVDLTDLIQEIALHVLKVSHRYQDTRGASSSFVWAVSANYCRVVSERYSFQKRDNSKCVTLDNHTPVPTDVDPYIRFLDARKGVESILEQASNELRGALSNLFERKGTRDFTPEVKDELKSLTTLCRVSYDDFRAVLWAAALLG